MNKIIINLVNYFIKNGLVSLFQNAYWDAKFLELGEYCERGNGVKFYSTTKLYNRQKKRSSISIGTNSHVKGELMVMAYGGSIRIGNNVFIGENSRIWSAENIIIGNNVLISHNVNIIDTNSHEINHEQRAEDFLHLITNGPSMTKGSIKSSPITIEDYSWINFNVFISKGVRIGKGAIIAPHSVVLHDVPDWAVVAGNPAKIIDRTS